VNPSGLIAVPSLSFLLLASLPGCTNTYTLERIPLETPAADVEHQRLNVGGRIIVSQPLDGRYGNKVYTGSGIMVQLAVVECLQARGLDAVSRDDLSGADQAAITGSWNITPTILEWEDRATEWSGLPDKIRIKLLTLDNAGRLYDATIVSGSSKWATLGGEHPQHMLRPALRPWVDQLLGRGANTEP
jgi:hypothetical protein